MFRQPGFRRSALSVAVAMAFALGAERGHANGSGAQVVNGQAAITSQGKAMTVVNTPGAIINWQSFSIARDESTHFQQQNAASAVMNRVVGQNPSQILGTLTSNGRVFLVNPNGMVFGRDAIVNTNGFVASTLNITDQNFKDAMQKGEALRFANGGAAGTIEVDGQIKGNAGDVYLIAPKVATGGTAIVSSQGGNVVLAAGETVEIRGRNLNDISFQVRGGENEAVNLGNLSGGAVGVFAGTLRHSGVIRATTLASEGGKIVLKAQGNVTLTGGSQTVADGQTRGGSVRVESQTGNVTVEAGALVSAQATGGTGGEIALAAQAGIAGIETAARVTASGGRGGSVAMNALKIAQEGIVEANGSAGDGGSITLIADRRIVQTASAQVNATGVGHGGSIVISADAAPDGDGSVFTSASIDASAGTGTGGSIRIGGRDLFFVASHLEAGGDAGGGSIDAGGRRNNDDPAAPNSQTVYANAAANFRASARRSGNGGNILLWSDDATTVSGNLEARGGAQSGDGGMIEVSGKESTRFGGMADAGAVNGRSGTFLIDPKFILIQAPVVTPGVSVELIDPNPGSSNFFGASRQVFSNGNILVLNYNDDYAGADSGAVYLYDGNTGALISNLRGSTAGDQVGLSGIQFLSGSTNFYIRSPVWSGSKGALTLGNVATGVSGTVSAGNSLVGSTASDQVGNTSFSFLGSKVVIRTSAWSGGKGAITWGDAVTGVIGTISAANSLVGSTAGDAVGAAGFTSLSNGNYVLLNSGWNGGAGAITFVNPAAPPTGAVSSVNSLVGSSAGDGVGSAFQNLFNGKSVARASSWNGGMGAVTWYNNASGTYGAVSSANSLVGSSTTDQVGSNSLINFSNGKGAIYTPAWNGNAGALTFVADLTVGITGTVSGANSLVGASPGDLLGSGGISTLSNGNRVVLSPAASIGASSTGAVTWFSATTGVTGPLTAANSLVGTHASDQVGSGGITNLGGGNYVIRSPEWNGTRGAATWASGVQPITGAPDAITSAAGSSVYGTTAGDRVGDNGVWLLNNGNFLVRSQSWSNNGTVTGGGALTFGDWASGFAMPGPVTDTNSLVGNSAGDAIGSGGIVNLSSGNYVVKSPNWSGGAGAVTFGDGSIMQAGTVVAGDARSIVGSASSDHVGGGSVQILSYAGGHFLVTSPDWNGNAGAVTWGSKTTGFVNPGTVGTSNSFVGGAPNSYVGSGAITQLYSGNYLIYSPQWNGGAGAVTFAPGNAALTGTLGAADGRSLLGATPTDALGSGGIQILDNGHFIVKSPNWSNSGSLNAGAVTWGSESSGFVNPGFVDNTNSLVGTHAGDRVGNEGIIEFYSSSNGNYLILSRNWNGGAGAVTFAPGNAAVTGDVGPADGRSIVGGLATDMVGSGSVQGLYDGNYLVLSPNWGNAGSLNAGAITWVNRDTGFITTGTLNNVNSLVGTHAGDQLGAVGGFTLYTLYNTGKHVMTNSFWNGNAGAATWFNPATGIVGDLTDVNSLVGAPGDGVGASVQEFGSRYLVRSPGFVNGAATNAGAITTGDSASGVSGLVSATNSLVGSHTGDAIGGSTAILSLSGGQLFRSSTWYGGRGALYFIPYSGTNTGVVDAPNSLVGTTANDGIGSGGVGTLSSGKYAVFSPNWNNGAATTAGAVTWIDGSAMLSGFTGTVSTGNSLYGSTIGDRVGLNGLASIGGGMSVVKSSNWDNGALANVGALTWINPAAPLTGAVSTANSLVGAAASDALGATTTIYTGSGYSVMRNSSASTFGAVTWLNTATPVTGALSSANSLVGAASGDNIGSFGVGFLSNGSYYVLSPAFAGGAGAVSIGSASGGIAGMVAAGNSLVGQTAGDGYGNSVQTLSNSRLLVTASSADSNLLTNNGRVHIYAGGAGGGSGPSGALGSQLFSDTPGSSVTITPAQITAITNTGTNVVLQANTDITLAAGSDIVTRPSSGNGGSLTLQAGRSVMLNSSIVTANGNLRIDANDAGANQSYRDAGMAAIFMADGTRIDAGTGRVEMYLHGGSQQGDIAVRSIAASSLVLQNDTGGVRVGATDATTPSDIIVGGSAEIIAVTAIKFLGGSGSAHALLSANGQITIDPPQLVMQSGSSPDAYARIINPTQQFPIRLVVSECVDCVFVSPFEITGRLNLTAGLDSVVLGPILSGNPNPIANLPPVKKAKGNLEIEADDTCK